MCTGPVTPKPFMVYTGNINQHTKTMKNESTPNEEEHEPQTVHTDSDAVSSTKPGLIDRQTRRRPDVEAWHVTVRSKVGKTLRQVVLPSNATHLSILWRLLAVSALVAVSITLGCGPAGSNTSPLCTSISMAIASLL